ncbi:AAA family ATPase [Lewinellaceae bacterium SD302]|nr:AAA family ATPase [Lewinellaceae bacterium SD302]
MRMTAITLSDDFNYALDRMEEGSNLFITGRAGTGKSTLLRIFRQTTKRKCVVLAPTGVAALNVQGQTIHSFFGFPPRLLQPHDVKPNRRNYRIFEAMEILIIDEISMVRADVMDAINIGLQINRRNSEPFGGVQIVFFGDLYQLPPVVSSEAERLYFRETYASQYFFSADCLDDIELEMIELRQVYRQDSRYFLRLLEGIRNATIDMDDLEDLNQRHKPDYDTSGQNYLTLAARNAKVNSINAKELDALVNPVHTYLAEIKGNFPERLYPTDAAIQLKEGAQVMTLRNDTDKRYVNGTIGTITKCKPETIMILTGEGDQEREIEVGYEEWDIIRYNMDLSKPGEIGTESIGTFKQLPVRLAWAVTIHKAQGKTFDKVVIDLGSGAFESGQTYVALSRCRSLDGIILSSPIRPRDVMVDPAIVEWYSMMRR